MKSLLILAGAALALAGGLCAVPTAHAGSASAAPVPAVPTRLAAAGLSQPIGSQVRLSWFPVSRATGYSVYRDGVLLAGAPRPSFVDYSVAGGETHAYAVSSLGAGGESRPSAPVSARVPSGGASVVYADGLENGWQCWGWAGISLDSASPVRAGRAIRVSAGPWQALYLHHDPLKAGAYSAVTFWIHGGASGGQQLWVKVLRSGVPQAAVALGPLAAGKWQAVTIPLSDLGAAGAADLDGLWVQNATGQTLPDFSVDEIALIPAVLTPPAAPAGLTATPRWAASCPKCGGMAMAHIVLAWSAVSGAASYTVYRDGVKVQAGLTSADWTDMDVVSGKSYTYTVTATGAGGESVPSAPATATAPFPPDALTAPANLGVQGVWNGAPSDLLAWSPVPGAASYNVYQYDVLIAHGQTLPSYAVPADLYSPGLTYTVTAVDAAGTESLPSAVATAQGRTDPAAQPGWMPDPPTVPTLPVAVAEWNAGRPRVHLTWHGNHTDFTFNVYRDGKKVASGLWCLGFYDADVQPGESHVYTVTGVNVPWTQMLESAPSVAAAVTALASGPSAAPGTVSVTGVEPGDDSAVVSFAAVPGATDYRVRDLAHPNTVKYSGGGLSVEMNGLDTVNGADLVVEAVDKLGPFQKMDGMAGPGAMQMDGMHSAINGQGDPSNVPNVLAVSAPVHAACRPLTLSGAQAFFDSFRAEQPLVAQPCPAPIPGDTGGEYGNPANYLALANDKWEMREYAADLTNTKIFFMGSHFMETLFDGGTPHTNGPMHNNNASLVMVPKATADIAGDKVLHVTFEVDAHFNGRRWCDLVVAPAGDPFINPGKLDGGLWPNTSGNLFRWEIKPGFHIPELFLKNTQTDLVQIANGILQDAPNVARTFWDGSPLMNGTPQDLDHRHRFDLYLSRKHFRLLEAGQLVKDADFPAGMALPFDKCQVYFVHQLYHTGNDRNELVDWYPGECYWSNYRPWSDERHWDNMGFRVLDGFPALP